MSQINKMYKVVIGASTVTSVAFLLAGCSHKQPSGPPSGPKTCAGATQAQCKGSIGGHECQWVSKSNQCEDKPPAPPAPGTCAEVKNRVYCDSIPQCKWASNQCEDNIPSSGPKTCAEATQAQCTGSIGGHDCQWVTTPNCTATAQFESACPVTKSDPNIRSCRGFTLGQCDIQWTSDMGYKCMPFTKVTGDVFDKVESDGTGVCAQYDGDQQSCNQQTQCVFASNWNSTTGTRFFHYNYKRFQIRTGLLSICLLNLENFKYQNSKR
jgi:hypothetical protein